jgi:hypothetical protein
MLQPKYFGIVQTLKMDLRVDPFVDLPHMVNFFYVFLLICDIYALHLINIFRT